MLSSVASGEAGGGGRVCSGIKFPSLSHGKAGDAMSRWSYRINDVCTIKFWMVFDVKLMSWIGFRVRRERVMMSIVMLRSVV